MKIIVLCITSLFFFDIIFTKHNNQVLFAQGNNAFMSGQFKEALDNYEKIENKNSVIWQNIGNCFYNQKKYDKALVCWKRAQNGARWNQLGQLFISEQMALKALRLPSDPGWKYEIKRVAIIIPTLLLQILLFLLLIYVLLVSSRYWYISNFISHKHKERWLVLFGIFLCSMVWYGQTRIFKKGKALIVKENVIVHAGPEKTFHTKCQLPLGSQVYVLNSEQDMSQISYKTELGKKERGWIVSNFIEIV